MHLYQVYAPSVVMFVTAWKKHLHMRDALDVSVFSKVDVSRFNQTTAVAFSDILGFCLGFGVVTLALKVNGLGLGSCSLVNITASSSSPLSS